MVDTDRTELEAAAFRQLLAHLQQHTEVQNIELMILADFCRNCLANGTRRRRPNAVSASITSKPARSFTACPTPNGRINTSAKLLRNNWQPTRPGKNSRRVHERR